MPTYEYACTSCTHEWECEQSIREDPLKECPACHQATAKRQISRGTGFILKGGGWYSDLYSSPGNKPPDSKADASGKKSASKDTPASGESATKPASPSEPSKSAPVAAA